MSSDLLVNSIVRRSTHEHPEFCASIHSWNLAHGPAGTAYELYLVLAGCPLRCRNCPTPEVWTDSGGQATSLVEVLCRLWLCYDAIHGSGGGLTLTGGDPFAQPRFTAEVLREAHSAGYRTTVETTGYLGALIQDTTLSQIDRLALDIKTVTPKLYRELTGVEVGPTLTFARRLRERDLEVVVRYLLIPGVTDSDANIHEIAGFVGTLGPRARLEIVGFGHFGQQNYRRLGLRQPFARVDPASGDDLERVRNLFLENGLASTFAALAASSHPLD